jgi:hypothetical protein
MRRLRLCFANTNPGRLGEPSDPTMRVCLRWLDADRTNGGGSCRDQGGRSPLSGPGSTVPRCKVAAAKRREACAWRYQARAQAQPSGARCVRKAAWRRGWIRSASRRSAPSFAHRARRETVEGKGLRAHPAPAKEYGRCRARVSSPLPACGEEKTGDEARPRSKDRKMYATRGKAYAGQRFGFASAPGARER